MNFELKIYDKFNAQVLPTLCTAPRVAIDTDVNFRVLLFQKF